MNTAAVTWCNFSCNLKRNSSFKTCKLVKNVSFAKISLGKSNEDSYLPISYLLIVELRRKLQEKLHRVTEPSRQRRARKTDPYFECKLIIMTSVVHERVERNTPKISRNVKYFWTRQQFLETSISHSFVSFTF